MGFLVCNEAFKQRFHSIWFDFLINAIIEKESVGDFYFVAATNQLAWNFKLNFSEKYFEAKGKPLVNFAISNLEGLVRKVFDSVKPKNVGKVLSDAYRFLIFKEAFDRTHLQFFRQKDQEVSLFVIKWLSQIIFGLKEDGITVENFETELMNVNDKITNLPKFIDTKALFEEYQLILQESNLFDIVDALNYSTEWLNKYYEQEVDKGNKPIIPFLDKEKAFLFFGFYDFKIPEIKFLGALGRYQNPIGIFLDFDATNGPLFGNYVDLIDNLKRYNFFALEVESDGEETNVSFFKKYLFNNFSGKSKPELSQKIKICVVENRYKEAKQIAKLCKYLISQEKFKPSDICITTKAPENYAPLFREVFREVCVPVNITERFRLSSSPLVLSILSALNLVAKGFRFKDLRKVLLSFYFRFFKTDENGKQNVIDTENFLSVATNMKGLGGDELGGKNYWIRRFNNRLKIIEERINFLKSASYPDEMELTNLERERSQVQKAKEDFEALLNYFDFENRNVTVEQFYDIVLNRIIKRFGVLEVLDNVVENLLNSLDGLSTYDKISKIEEVEKDTRALSKFLALLEEFTFLTSTRYKDQKFTLSELLELFKVVIFEERFQISKKTDYGVTITTIEQTRGIPYKVMILCGAIDGELPRRYTPEKFLGKELGKSEKRHFENERLEFFFFLTNNPQLFNQNDRLTYIFYPKRDLKREFVPSPFIFSLSDLFPDKKNDVFFDLTESKPSSLPKGMEWVEVVASNVESNLLLKEQADSTVDNLFFEDIQSIYFKKNQHNILQNNRLTKESLDFFQNLTKKPVSISFLEDYNKCPYRFFVDRILDIEKPSHEMELFLTNREKGEILHIIVANFYKKLAEECLNKGDFDFVFTLGTKKFVPVKIDLEKRNEYFELIENITKVILQKFNTEISLFDIDIEEFITNETGRIGLVQLWLNYELSRANWGYFPCFFELSFGMNYKDTLPPVKIQLSENDSIFLRGKIDRIDVLKRDTDLELIIIDYKLNPSEAANKNDIFKGTAFQMPFYAIAFTEIINEYTTCNVYLVDLLYQIFRFRRDKRKDRNDTLNYKKFFVNKTSSLNFIFNKSQGDTSSEDFNVWLELAKKIALDTLNSIIKKKDFPVNPLKGKNICKYCQFKSICKIEIASSF
ncbi:MAG: PD-(D/E)XK nuclease family protein [Candidatus Kapaibacteriota bacterium]